MFLNESEEVVRKGEAREILKLSRPRPKLKARRKKTQDVARRDENMEDPERILPLSWRSKLILDEVESWNHFVFLPHSIAPAVEEHAIVFFLTHYVQSNHSHTRGQFEFLPGLCYTPGIDRAFSLAVSAVGLAGLANAARSPDLLAQAKQRYSKSVQMTTFALSQPDLVKRDTTLLSVLLLGMFEGITFEDRESLKSWDRHIAGAAVLISMRGRTQFSTTLGIRIFQLFYNHYLFHCTRNRKAADEELRGLCSHAASLCDPDSPEWRLTEISTRWVKFIATAHKMTGHRGGDSKAVAAAAAKIDQDLLELSQSMTGSWGYDVVYLDSDSSTDLAFHGYYHVYSETWQAQVWNSLRGLRVLLNELLSGLLLRVIAGFANPHDVPRELRLRYERGIAAQRTLTADICATIPQQIGQVPDQMRGTVHEESFPSEAWGKNRPASGSVTSNQSSFMASTCESESFSRAISSPLEAQFVSSKPGPPIEREMFDRATSVNAPSPSPSTASTPKTPSSGSTGLPKKSSGVQLIDFEHGNSVGRGINFLLWPLFVVGNIHTTSPELRRWIVSRLEIVSRVNGNCQAKVLAIMLKDPAAGKGFRP